MRLSRWPIKPDEAVIYFNREIILPGEAPNCGPGNDRCMRG